MKGGNGVLGQPHGVGMLVLVEGLSSFAFYGLRILLVLYMTRQVLLPGHAEYVVGLVPLRSLLEHAYGPLSVVAFASVVFGLFSSIAYLTPLAGALIADRWLGRTRAILVGGLLMVIGSALLVREAGFVIGLLFLLPGAGLWGGNLTAQLGDLYSQDDPRRGDGFQLYYLAVDAGVIVAPLICGTLGETRGFGYGFAAAALGMVAALGAYLAGRRRLPASPRPDRAHAKPDHPPIDRRDWTSVFVLLLLIPVIGVAAVANNQIYGAYELWGAAHYDLVFFGRQMPVTWLIAIDAFISFGCGFVVLACWRWLEARDRLPSEIDRCAIGAALSALAAFVLVLASWSAGAHRIGLGWALAFHTINNLGVAMLFPLTLALFSRAAPAALKATMINSSKLNFFVSFQIVGWLGGFIDRIDSATFWLIHAAIVAAAAAVLFAFGRLFRGVLAPATMAASRYMI